MISVIIPSLNEEDNIPGLVSDLRSSDLISEIIMVDGGSFDNTVAVAHTLGLEVVSSKKGRAMQMNKGAALSKNDILLFLHADSRISKASIEAIPKALNKSVAGSFYLAFDKKHRVLDFYSSMSRLSYSLFTYGDQGLFISRKVFDEIEGFREIPIMEDIDLIRRVKKKGRFEKIDQPVISSSRRFVKYGVLRQQLRNILLVLLFYIGFKPDFLARFYSY